MSNTARTIVVEACANGTITRANARAINRVCTHAKDPATTLSGTSTVADAIAFLELHGCVARVVAAASLSGADKARHTREITRSRKAQTARAARKAVAVAA